MRSAISGAGSARQSCAASKRGRHNNRRTIGERQVTNPHFFLLNGFCIHVRVRPLCGAQASNSAAAIRLRASSTSLRLRSIAMRRIAP